MELLTLSHRIGALVTMVAVYFLLSRRDATTRLISAIGGAYIFQMGALIFEELYGSKVISFVLAAVVVLALALLMLPGELRWRTPVVLSLVAVLLLHHGWTQVQHNANLRYRSLLKEFPQDFTHRENVHSVEFFSVASQQEPIALEVHLHKDIDRKMVRETAVEAMQRVDELFPIDMEQSIPLNLEEFKLYINSVEHLDNINCTRTLTTDPQTGEPRYLWHIDYFDAKLQDESYTTVIP